MKYDRSTDTVQISCEELSSFAVRKKSGNSIDNLFKPVYAYSDVLSDFAEREERASLQYTFNFENQRVSVISEAESVTVTENHCIIESLKRCRKMPARFTALSDPVFFASSAVTAFLYCCANNKNGAVIRLTLRSGDESMSYDGSFSADSLSAMFDVLMKRAAPFITLAVERGSTRIDEITKLSFPYGQMRGGQRDFMVSVMRAVRHGTKLLACAPTGIGKTISALYPSVKSIGSGYADKIFYLTSKSVTGRAAFDAMKTLSKTAPHVRTVMLQAKEIMCSTGSMKEGCYYCPMMSDTVNEGEFSPCKLRCAEAVLDIMYSGSVYSPEMISDTAEKYHVCPYELSLSVSELCDVIICDYNYVFDMKIRLRRYFVNNKNDESFVFLIDEAHNLPDRTRAMYSAEFSPEDLNEILSLSAQDCSFDVELRSAAEKTLDAFEYVMSLCEENSSLTGDGSGEHITGYYKSSDFPDVLRAAVLALNSACVYRARQKTEYAEIFWRMAQKTGKLFSVLEAADERFRFLAQRRDNELKCSMMCLDPSDIIMQMSKIARAVVMFSATLNPTEYFTNVLGCRENEFMELDSPYDKENLSITVFDSISTRLSDREKTASETAKVIHAAVSSKKGKYLVYFPSYRYMETVCREYLRLKPKEPVVMQKSGMNKKTRDKFISVFSSDKYESATGFCVLGGMFSEGLDLTGESLIGVIIVGSGLSGISSELNLMSEYYDEKYERGYEFAYLYPAINKIQQAVGRVIRTDSDRGIAVLIDHRMSDPGIIKLFPKYWPGVKCVSDIDSLTHILDSFWENKS